MAKVLYDILIAIDRGNIAALALLDCSAVFDTVDHNILLHELGESFSFNSRSPLTCSVFDTTDNSPIVNRSIMVFHRDRSLDLCYLSLTLRTSVHYTHLLHSHQYADDTQVYGWQPPAEESALRDRLSNCVEDICSWMCSDRLQLNTSKTEFI